VTERSTHDHCIGDLVVNDLDSRYGLVSEHQPRDGMIGIIVDKVPGYGPEFDVDVLHVLWPDGTTRTRWDYQVLPLGE
jgi:hypothetical protein